MSEDLGKIDHAASQITELVLFVVAAVALGLLLIGIHNAWDSVTHIVVSSAANDSTRTD